MSAEAWPTEAMSTDAVEAAAKRQYERTKMDEWPAWENLGPIHQLNIRDTVLDLVWAALKALPDPRYAAWEEGRAAGSSDTAFESEGYGTPPPSYPHENPYPSGL